MCQQIYHLQHKFQGDITPADYWTPQRIISSYCRRISSSSQPGTSGGGCFLSFDGGSLSLLLSGELDVNVKSKVDSLRVHLERLVKQALRLCVGQYGR